MCFLKMNNKVIYDNQIFTLVSQVEDKDYYILENPTTIVSTPSCFFEFLFQNLSVSFETALVKRVEGFLVVTFIKDKWSNIDNFSIKKLSKQTKFKVIGRKEYLYSLYTKQELKNIIGKL